MRVITNGPRVVGIEVAMAGIPPTPNETRGQHWGNAKRNTDQWKGDAMRLFAEATRRAERAGHHPNFPWPAVDIEVTFRFEKPGRHDVDNLIASLKPVIDGIVAARLMRDDDFTHLDNIQAVVQRRRAVERGMVILVRRCVHLPEQQDLLVAPGPLAATVAEVAAIAMARAPKE